MFKRILIATDGSVNAKRATQVAIELAKRHGSELVVVHAIPQPVMPVAAPLGAPLEPVSLPGAFGPFVEEYYKRSREAARTLVREAIDLAKEQGMTARREVLDASESVAEQLVDFSKNERVDLIVVGTRGLTRFRALLLGSVSGALVSHAPCSVLVVR